MDDQERRFHWRVSIRYPARLWIRDAAGRLWKRDVVLDNLSAGGLYLRLNRSIRQDTYLSVAVRLSIAPATTPALRLVVRGVVLRAEPKPDGAWGVAVEFGRRRVFG